MGTALTLILQGFQRYLSGAPVRGLYCFESLPFNAGDQPLPGLGAKRANGISGFGPVKHPLMQTTLPTFVPVPMPSVVAESHNIQIEIRRNNTAIKLDWPLQASADCAAWLRDWLR